MNSPAFAPHSDSRRRFLSGSAALGAPYVGRIASDLLALHPGAGWKIHNRGISGDRSVDLLGRWRRDALALQPDVLSSWAGVNDTWHDQSRRSAGAGERVQRHFRALSSDVRRGTEAIFRGRAARGRRASFSVGPPVNGASLA